MTKCRTIFLGDDPANEDLFGNKSYEKTSKSIIEVIKTQQGGKCIGLEGRWGSGKSSIIEFIRKKIEKDNDYAIFIFNAWTHQGDPLRRIILNALLDYLETISWIDEDLKKELLEKINTKVIADEGSNEFLKISTLGYLLIGFLLVFSSIGLGLIGYATEKFGVNFGTDYFISKSFLFGIGSLILPYLIILIIQQLVKDKNNGLLGLIINQIPKTKITVKQEKINPSSYDFKYILNEIIQSVFTDNPNRKLILVFDNLDRISSFDANILISNIEIFFEKYSFDNKYLENLWVIIPYDKEGMFNIWKAQPQIEATNNLKNFLDIPESMLEKKFQIIFPVPSPIISDKYRFFIDQIKKALPDHDRNDFPEIFNFFQQIEKSEYFSPRKIKLFINALCTYHLETDCTIPLKHIAFFIFIKHTVRNYIEIITGNNFENEYKEYISYLGNNLQSNCIALLLNTNRIEALELLTAERLRNHILSLKIGINKEPEFKVTDECLSLSFINLLEEDWFSSPQEYFKATTFLYSKKKTSNASIPFKDQIYRRFLYVFDTFTSFDFSIPNIDNGIIIFFNLFNQSGDIFSKILIKINNSRINENYVIERIDANNLDTFSKLIQSWVQCTEHILNQCSIESNLIKNDEIKINLPFKNTLSIIEYYSALYTITQDKKIILNRNHSIPFDTLNSDFIQLIDKNYISGRHIGFINTMLIINKLKSDIVFNAIDSKLSSEKVNEVTPLLEILYILDRDNAIFEQNITKIVNEKFYFYRYVTKAKGSADNDALAFCLLLHLLYSKYSNTSDPRIRDGFQIVQQIIKKPSDFPDLFISFNNIVKKYKNQKDILSKIIKNKNNYSFIREWLPTLDTEIKSEIDADLVGTNWSIFREILGDEQFDIFLKETFPSEERFSKFLSSNFDEGKILLYIFLLENDYINEHVSLKNVLNQLSSWDREKWSSELSTKDNIHNLLITISKKKISLNLSTAFTDGILDFFKNFLSNNGNVITDPDDKEIFKLINKDSLLNELRKNIIQELCTKQGNFPNKLFLVFGELISYKNIVSDNPNVIESLFNQILINGNDESLQWLVQLFNQYPLILRGLEERDDRNIFFDRIRENLKTQNPKQQYTDLAEILKKNYKDFEKKL